MTRVGVSARKLPIVIPNAKVWESASIARRERGAKIAALNWTGRESTQSIDEKQA